ncbi:hypothetical protein [Ligilactobacillus equi]|uniref:DNA-binding helix-turn-helix protein n=1 Tax=Ligilactobacillus equi DPC 6820 TaxID=1392007 RepID=V7HV13_9LACO|nr:hypothetical protein [Ligilactobacillus equi]ETA73737.1 DNA-binding helix-turn-helix protein [Ligilactobacillus equi DPC 6820]
MSNEHIDFNEYLEEQLSDQKKKKHFDNQKIKLDNDFKRALGKSFAENKEALKYLKDK